MSCSRVKTKLSGEQNALVQARDGSGFGFRLKKKSSEKKRKRLKDIKEVVFLLYNEWMGADREENQD